MQGCPLGLEVVEVRQHGGGSALAGETILDNGVGRRRRGHRRAIADQTVVVGLLDPLVDHGARPGARHFWAKDGGLVVKGTGLGGVAARLREEDRNGVVRRILLQYVVTRDRVAGVAAPLIGVQRVEVQALGVVAGACQVVLEHGPQSRNVSSGVANGNVAVVLLVTVRLDVPSSGENVWSSSRTFRSGEHFIANEDAGRVVKLLELVKHRLEVVKLGLVPVRVGLSPLSVARSIYIRVNPRSYLLDLSVEGVQVHKQVDARIRERRHAALVVGLGVHVVHTDRVGTQLGHASDVALALVGVDERILGSELIGDPWVWLVCRVKSMRGNVRRTLQVVLGAILVEELGSDGGDGLDGAHRRRLQAGQQQRHCGERKGGNHGDR